MASEHEGAQQFNNLPVSMAHSLPIRPMPEFNPDAELGASVATRWKNWVADFDMFLLASGVTDTKRQRALLLYQAGARVREIFKQLDGWMDGWMDQLYLKTH